MTTPGVLPKFWQRIGIGDIILCQGRTSGYSNTVSVENATQKIIGVSPLWDNGASLDYDKPIDMRNHFDFACFDIKYDFVKSCEFTQEFIKKTNKLLNCIHSL